MAQAIDLGNQYLQGLFVKPGHVKPPQRKLPKRLVRCDIAQDDNACGLLQLARTFPPDVLYTNYWYRPGANRTMREHLAGIVESTLAFDYGEKKTLRVLDIGCNDETLLSAYPDNFERFGVDPSDIAREIKPPITVVNTVFPSERAFSVFGEKKFDQERGRS